MRPSEALETHRAEIRRIVAANRATNARVFGSVLHRADTESSDLDLLVDPTDTTTLLDLARIQRQLQSLLGVPVDVKTPKALAPNFRGQVLEEARPV